MLEWWQALLISVASAASVGSVGLITAFVVNKWGIASRREAEEWQVASRVAEEERQVRRELRRERLGPVFKYLDLAREGYAHDYLMESQGRIWDDNVDDVQAKMTKEDWLKAIRAAHPGPTAVDSTLALMTAFATSPTKQIQKALRDIVAARVEGNSRRDVGNALGAAEELVERYIAELDTADDGVA